MTDRAWNTSDPIPPVGDRLMEIVRHYGLTKNSFAIKIGMSNNSLITRIINEKWRGMSLDLVQRILCTYPELNPEWFVLGIGNMIKTKMELHTKYYKEVGQIAPLDQMRIAGFDDCEIAFDMVGTGMSPRYKTGDILLCKEVISDEKIQYGEAYLIISDNKPLVRYIKSMIEGSKYKLGAEDTRYEDSTIAIKDIQRMYMIKGLVRREVF
jgi:hypothetical protein